MSADIDSMSYVGEVPWHGLGTELPNDPDTMSVYRLSGLDWDVELSPAYTDVVGERVRIPETCAVVRTDHGEPLATVSDSYQPIQNRELFAIADTVASETKAEFETAGALGRGEEVFVCMRFPEPMEIPGDPQGRIEKYFLIRSSHDGSHALDTRFTPVRVVCRNTLSLAVSGSKTSFSIRHTESAPKKIAQVQKSLKAAAAYYDSLEEVLTAWTRRPLELSRFIEEVAEELFPVDEETQERSGKAQADFERLVHLATDGEGMNRSIQGTAYGALQAATAFADHVKTFRSSANFNRDESRMRSILDGSAARFKQTAYELIDEAAA